MLARNVETEFGECKDSTGVTLRYSLDVLEEVRRLCVDGLSAFSHGGKEAGGVLYGTRQLDSIEVVSYAEVPCQHALGPRFRLSDHDRLTLAELLIPPPGQEVVGWFRAHTRSGLDLDPDDRLMFSLYFASHLSCALIVNPTVWGTATASFYVRHSESDILPASPDIFEISIRKPLPFVVTELEEPQPSDPQVHVAFPPAADLIPPRRKSTWALAAAAGLAGIAVLIYASHTLRKPDLLAYTIAPGQVRIEWNHRFPSGSAPASGSLEITDGDAITTLPLDSERLGAGSVTYHQRTGHIQVRMKFAGSRSTPAENVIDFVGPSVAPPAISTVPPSNPPAPSPLSQVESQAAAPRAEKAKLDSAPALQRSKQSSLSVPTAVAAASDAKSKPPSKASNAESPRRSMTPVLATVTPSARPVLIPPPPSIELAPAPAMRLPDILPNLATRPTSVATPPPSRTPSYTGARSGRVIWTGLLSKRGVIEIEGNHVSVGAVSGALPGVPLTVRVWPAEFDRGGLILYTADRSKTASVEPPSKSNGWNATHFKVDEGRARDVVILEAPNRSNDFSRLVLRNDGRDYNVIVVDWSIQLSDLR